jgi:hypothetical protein
MLLGMLCFGIACQAQYANRQYAQIAPASLKSINSFSETTTTRMPGERMKNVGTALTLSGSALLIGGIILTATTDFNNLTDDNDDLNKKEVRHLTYGIELLVFGVGMTTTGIVLWTKGSHKLSRYKKEQNITLGTKGAGLSLKYHF